MTTQRFITAIATLAISGVTLAQDAPTPEPIYVQTLEPEQREQLAGTLAEEAVAPTDYIVSKLRDHKVVVLGELYNVADYCTLIADTLAPAYHNANLRTLAMQNIYSRNNAKVEALITADKWSDEDALELARDYAWPWAFAEYTAILKAAWSLNASLSEDAPKLRVIGLDHDWTQYDMLFDADSPTYRKQLELDREIHMIETFLEEGTTDDATTLVQIGFEHVMGGAVGRFGGIVRRNLDDDYFCIGLHTAMPGERGLAQITPVIEDLYARNGEKPIGFDLDGSQLGDIADPFCGYFQIIDMRATFKDVADGYIIIKPYKKMTPASYLQGSVSQRRFYEAREVGFAMKFWSKVNIPDLETLEATLARTFPGGDQSQ